MLALKRDEINQVTSKEMKRYQIVINGNILTGVIWFILSVFPKGTINRTKQFH
jgi:hypothetical protein